MRKFFTLFFVISAVIGVFVIGCSSTTDDNTTDHIGKIVGPEFTTANDPNPVKVPENAVEIVSKRGRHAKIYDNLDGTFTAVIHTKSVHYKDENDQWQEIEDFSGLAKMAAYTEVTADTTANPQYMYNANPPYYGDICPESKLGEEEGATDATSRLLPEFDLTTPDGIASVSAATIYYTPADTTSLTMVGITTYIGINYRPTLMHGQGNHQTNYDNCANPLTSLSLSEGEKNFGLGSYERGKIKDRCNAGDEDDEWYAVGYKLNDETVSSGLSDDLHKLEFVFSY